MGDVCVAAYSIGLFSIRYQTITSRPISLSLPDRHEYRGRPNPKLYHFRGTECFKLLPKKPKVLVITNSNMTEIPIVRLLVEEARKIAEKVVVINGTVARLMYGLNSIDKEVIRIYGRILVAWLLPEYVEYIILQREPDNFRPKFREFGDDQDFYRIFQHQRPDYVLILYRKNNQERAFDLADGLPREFGHCFVREYEKFPFAIVDGSIHFAWSTLREWGNWTLSNFSTGFCAKFFRSQNVFVPFGTDYPFSIKPMPTRDGHHIAFANEPVEKGDRIPLLSENAFAMKMFTPDLINTTVLVFDKNGIPYDGEINKLVTFYFNLLGNDYENYSEVVQKSVATVVQPEYSRFSEVNVQRQLPLSEMENLALTDEESLDLPDDLLPVSENSEYQNEETDTEAPCDVRIILREDGFARMCCQKNQQTSYLKFMEDEEWIPMYLSLKTGFPVVGAETIKDMESHPESVVFDILDLCGKEYSELEMNPKWGFKVNADDDNNVAITVSTMKGPMTFSSTFVLSMILKALRSFAESELGQEIDFKLQVNFDFSEKLRQSLIKACEKTEIEFLD